MTKRAVALFLLVLLWYGYAGAQQLMPIDSLERLLPTAPDDSEKFMTLTRLGLLHEGNDLKKAKMYYQKAGDLAKKINYRNGIFKSYADYGYVLNMEGSYDSALTIGLKAVALARRLNDSLNLAMALLNAAGTYRMLAQYENAVRYNEEGIALFRTRGVDSLMAIADDSQQTLYNEMRQYKKAIAYGERSVATLRKFGPSVSLGISLNNLGLNYENTYQLDKAEKAYLEALQVSKKFNYQSMELSGYLNLGSILLKKGDYRTAGMYFNKGLQLAEDLGIQESKVNAWVGLSHYHQFEGAFNAAKDLLEHALQLSKEQHLDRAQVHVLKQLANVNYAMGQKGPGDRYEMAYDRLDDSLLNETILKSTRELEVKYASAQKEAQISQLRAEKNIQQLSLKNKNMVIILLVVLALAIALAGSLLYRNYLHKQKLQRLRISELETEKQLAATEAVLKGEEQERARLAKDLHDGLGGMLSGIKYSLNTVRGNLIMTPDNAQAFERSLEMLDSSIGEMRRVAHNMLPEALINFGLDNALHGFCQDINSSGALQVHYQSIGLAGMELAQGKAITLYRMVQELLNNILKHALANKAIVQLTRSEDVLSITVEDDGKGFDPALLQQTKGIGWNNLKNRVDFLNGKIDIDSQIGQGTSVLIEIPL